MNIKKYFIIISIILSFQVYSMELILNIPQIHCSSCASNIKRALQPYVKDPQLDIKVNLDTKNVYVNLDKEIPNSKIISNLGNIGYKVNTITRTPNKK